MEDNVRPTIDEIDRVLSTVRFGKIFSYLEYRLLIEGGDAYQNTLEAVRTAWKQYEIDRQAKGATFDEQRTKSTH